MTASSKDPVLAVTLIDTGWVSAVTRNLQADGRFYDSMKSTEVYYRPSRGSVAGVALGSGRGTCKLPDIENRICYSKPIRTLHSAMRCERLCGCYFNSIVSN